MEDGGARDVAAEPQAAVRVRIQTLRPDGPLVRSETDVAEIVMPRVPASHLRAGDHVRLASLSAPIREYLGTRNSLPQRARQLYFGQVGYVSQPRSDKRNELFVRAEVPESGLGIRALQLPNA